MTGDLDARLSQNCVKCNFPIGKIILDSEIKIWLPAVPLPSGGAEFRFFCPECRATYAFELSPEEMTAGRARFALEQNETRFIN